MKLTQYKAVDLAGHFADKIGQMFNKFSDNIAYAFEFQDRKAVMEFAQGKYTRVRIDDNHTRDKDKFHYEITLFNRNHEPVPMMKLPDETWMVLSDYFVELYTRGRYSKHWESS